VACLYGVSAGRGRWRGGSWNSEKGETRLAPVEHSARAPTSPA